MQLSTASMLRKRGHEVVFATPEPSVDADLYGLENIVTASRRDAKRAPLNVVRAALRRVTGRSLLGRDEEIDAYANADLVVDLSGDMLTEDYGVPVALSHFQPLLLAWLLGRPYVALAQSIGPFKWTSPIARLLLGQASLVTAREARTLNHLNKIGLRNVEVTADTAFLLEPVEVPNLPKQIASHRLGVSLSALAVEHHGDGDLVADVASAISALQSEVGDLEVLGIPHVTGPNDGKDDRLVLQLLQNHGIEIQVLGDLHPGAMKAAVASCDLLIGARMHANIAALGSGVPVVALAYSHKFHGIMSEFGQQDFVLDLGDFDEGLLQTYIQKLWQERSVVAEEIRGHREDVVVRATANFDRIESLIP